AVQLERLGADEQRILGRASVAGERFSTWVLAESDASRSGIDEVCDELARRQEFIRAAGIHEVADGIESPHYEFLHSLHRQFLYRRQTDVGLAKLHRQTAQRLETLCAPGCPELAGEIALHFERAREHPQAIRYLIASSENAAHRFAHR